VWAIVASAGVEGGFTLAVIGLPGTTTGRPSSAAASPIGRGGSGCGRFNLLVDCISQGVSADEASKLVPTGLKPDASFADWGIREKSPTPKKTATIQLAISPTDIR
jgi:hypothetical protein